MSERPPHSTDQPQPPHERQETPRLSVLQLLGERKEQQDAYIVRSREKQTGWHILIADGHGPQGKTIASTVNDQFDHTLAVLRTDIQPDDLQQMFQDAHESITTAHLDGGTTATVVLIEGAKLLAAWVGNSQARLVDKNGQLKTLTVPHEYLAHKGERARLDRQAIPVAHTGDPRAPRGHLLINNQHLECSRVLGDEDINRAAQAQGMAKPIIHEPEIKQATITSDDKFLLVATDGLWNKLKRLTDRAALSQILAQAKTAAEAKHKIKTFLQSKKLSDNITIIIIDLQK